MFSTDAPSDRRARWASKDLSQTSPRYLVGTLAAVYMLATTKWGSYLGAAPIFITDLLLLAAAWRSFTVRKGHRRPVLIRLTPVQVALLLSLPLWATIRLIASESYKFNTIRDFAPYLYAGIGLIAAVSMARSDRRQRDRTAHLIWIALVVHLTWISMVVAAPSLPEMLPRIGEGVRLLQPREDIDSAILGVTACVAIYRWTRTRKLPYIIVALISLIDVMLISSRAGLIATALCGLLIVWVVRKNSSESIAIAITALLSPVAAILAFDSLLKLPAVSRLVSTFWPALASTTREGYASAQGTTEARQHAWSAVLAYTGEKWDRSMFGAGFGSDFMQDSGAARLLLGPLAADSGVRSPHNYFIGTYARLGLVGLAIIMALVVVALIVIFLKGSKILGEELGVLASAVVIAVIPTAAFGVTLESPFGAIPFFWSVGILIGYLRITSSDHIVIPDQDHHSPKVAN